MSEYMFSFAVPKHPPEPNFEDLQSEAAKFLCCLELNGRNERQVLYAIYELERLSAEIRQLQEDRKRDCVDFFRWWHNQPGSNTEQGYEEWVASVSDRHTYKCEDCVFHGYSPGGQVDDPYPMHWCRKGHWEGGPMPKPGDPDPWTDCKDYESTAADSQDRICGYDDRTRSQLLQALYEWINVGASLDRVICAMDDRYGTVERRRTDND